MQQSSGGGSGAGGSYPPITHESSSSGMGVVAAAVNAAGDAEDTMGALSVGDVLAAADGCSVWLTPLPVPLS